MKTITTTLASAMIILFSFNTFALEKSNPLKDFNSTKFITVYLEAITLGNIDLNKFLFTKDFEYSNEVNNKKFNKKQYTDFLNANKGLKHDCSTSYEILDETESSCIAKAIMKFKTFTRVDHITLVHSSDGWKVSKALSIYF